MAGARTADEGRNWWVATNARATFAFATDRSGRRVVLCAPYGRKLIAGRDEQEALDILRRRRFEVSQLTS